MHVKNLLPLLVIATLFACNKDKNDDPFVNEDPATFAEIGSLDIGVKPVKAGAAEISAYDPITKRLFAVSNIDGDNKIVVIDFKDPAKMKVIKTINVAAYGLVNSVSIHNGKLAAAIEAPVKQNDGKVVVYNTNDTVNYSVIKVITVGALPDMVTFSPDGAFIVTANEGEPNTTYTVDPTGSVSVISVNDNYSVVNIDFASFAPQQAALALKGLRIAGLNTTFAKDIEPEYVTISPDSKTAWVTLQENNAIAKINLSTKTATDIFPLGFKDYNTDANAMDLSDKDGGFAPKKNKVKGIYMPDGIAVLMTGNIPYLFTANEGDAREYDAYADVKRMASAAIDPAMPDLANLKLEANLGRLNISTKIGDTNGDNLIDELYSLGARSFSVWNGNTGAQVYDSKNELDSKVHTSGIATYDDGRSDDKSIEPEGITIGVIGNRTIAFVGMERVDAVAIYDVTNPTAPVFKQIVKCGDAPEGVLFISAKDSPIKRSLLVVSSEDDGLIKVYKPNSL